MEDGTTLFIFNNLDTNTILSLLEFLDDVRSINSESTASISGEFGEDEKNLPQLERLSETKSVEESSNTGPPGTVKRRPPKDEKKVMDDQEVIDKLRELCINSDPLLIYSNMVKIGQG